MNKNGIVQIRITEGQKEKLKRISKEKDVGMSKIVRDAVDMYLSNKLSDIDSSNTLNKEVTNKIDEAIVSMMMAKKLL